MRKFIVAIFFLSVVINAQEKSVSQNVFSFRFDNDVFFGTDRYFTNGFYFSLTSSTFDDFFLNQYLFPHTDNRLKNYTLTLGQEIFTPQEKDSVRPILGDRPFSANLFLTYKQRTFTRKEILCEFEILLGIMGKHAFGEEVQNGIHWLLPPSGEVLGWENQLSDTPLIQYGVKYYSTLNEFGIIKLRSVLNAEIGQPRTRIGGGLFFLLNSQNFQLAETKYYSDLAWSFVIYPRIFYVLYNANLQGGIFTKNIYSISREDLTKLLLNLTSKLEIYYKKMSFHFGYEFITKEFRTGKYHIWLFTEIKYLF